jgi:hypothetical protein
MGGYREGVDWTELAHDIIHNKSPVNTTTNFRVTQKKWNYRSSWITVSFFKKYRSWYFCFRERGEFVITLESRRETTVETNARLLQK